MIGVGIGGGRKRGMKKGDAKDRNGAPCQIPACPPGLSLPVAVKTCFRKWCYFLLFPNGGL